MAQAMSDGILTRQEEERLRTFRDNLAPENSSSARGNVYAESWRSAMITNHIIMPIGIIKKSTGAGTTIRLIPPHPSADKLQPQMNILTRDSETGAHARAAVRVVEIQGNVARFDILNQR